MTKFSPCNIEVLLHCYYSTDAHPREDAASVISSYKLLELCGLIEPVYNEATNTNKYKTTERGRAHINQICTLPLPSSAWVDGNGKLINDSTAPN